MGSNHFERPMNDRGDMVVVVVVVVVVLVLAAVGVLTIDVADAASETFVVVVWR